MKNKESTKFICTECKDYYDLDDYVCSDVKNVCIKEEVCWCCATKHTPINVSEWF